MVHLVHSGSKVQRPMLGDVVCTFLDMVFVFHARIPTYSHSCSCMVHVCRASKLAWFTWFMLGDVSYTLLAMVLLVHARISAYTHHAGCMVHVFRASKPTRPL